jgi:acyl-CoA reductase-like NAD-dependent aldehyde dehydrogenase
MIIPALTGIGRDGYRSIEKKVLTGLDGSRLAEATVTPALLVHDLASRRCREFPSMPIRQILEILGRAADIFAHGRPDGLDPDDFVRNVTLNSGMPVSIVRTQTLELFPLALGRMAEFIEIQSPGGLRVFDDGWYEKGGIRIGFVPRGRNAGFVMPGNHPSVNFMWLQALAMKLPVVIRPSFDDIFTPYRIAMSLLDAGLPCEALAFVPGGHDLVDSIVRSCPLSVLFGSQQIQDLYGSRPNVRIHGPGRSKVAVLANSDFEKTVDLIVRMVMDDAGRGCINGSAVVVEGNCSRLAQAVAKALENVPALHPLDESARLGAVTNPAMSEAFNRMIDAGLADGSIEITPGRASRVTSVEGASIMRPVLIEAESHRHPLFGLELPFPFVVFAPAGSPLEMLEACRNSLAVVIAGDDAVFTKNLLLEPSIDKIFAQGSPSTEFDPREPHEGFLLDFLYQKKAVRLVGAGSLWSTA